MEPKQLEPLITDGVKKVLVVVAHPDDAEYGTSAAVAQWCASGIEVAYLLVTAGEAGMKRSPDEARLIRKQEQQKACKEVGVDRLTILDFADGMVEYGLPLRRAIAREIREFQPDAVVSGSGELIVPWGFDHADHRAVGLATIDAVRDADNRWVFTELTEEGLESWGATWMWLTGTSPSHYVEITEAECELAVASLAAHEAYLADLPWHPSPHDFIPPMLGGYGDRAGVPMAVTFSVHQLKG